MRPCQTSYEVNHLSSRQVSIQRETIALVELKTSRFTGFYAPNVRHSHILCSSPVDGNDCRFGYLFAVSFTGTSCIV